MSLDIAVTKSPFSKPSDKENFDTGRYICIDESDDLFLIVLEVPEIERHKGENRKDFLYRREKLFQENLTIKGYEMLGRIWDYFRDAFYLPSEVSKLLEECLEVQQKTRNELASSALKSLIFGCNEALKANNGIWFISD